MPARPTTIALYLPQFHPIPENDSWYGAGFTEWHNVVTAKPLFDGHYQPHLPAGSGFYDLRVPEVREAQARAARAHGIDAFCYYHYWFEGQRPLRRVLDEVLESSQPAFPFCLAWANENWSRHWDASNHEVLLRQRYSAEDDSAHGHFLLRVMSHPLYLRVAGRPLLFIYRIQAMPDPTATLARWREIWRAAGLEDVHIVKFDTHGDQSDPGGYGADAAAQFLPHNTSEMVSRTEIEGAHAGNAVFDYEDVVHAYLGAERPPWRRYECVVPGWDNSPRRGDGRSYMMHGSTPELYESWLAEVQRRAPDDGVVVINAWNEWAEGAHLEPDLRHGDAYLRATARALGLPPPAGGAIPPMVAAASAPPPRDRFAELYLDSLEAQVALQRRLSRLEATLDRQLEAARGEAEAETLQLRIEATSLLQENIRLKARLALDEDSPATEGTAGADPRPRPATHATNGRGHDAE
jgi:hypothetical protein